MSDNSAEKLSQAGVSDDQRIRMFGECQNKANGGIVGALKSIFGAAFDLVSGDIPGLTADFVKAWNETEAAEGCKSFLTNAEILKYYPPIGTPGHHYTR